MSESSIRKKQILNQMLEKLGEWDFPASEWEALVCSGMKEENIIVVPRASTEQLAWCRMQANRCHHNARWYAANDPSGNSQAIAGWWVQWPNFVLHSVIKSNGQLICITPSMTAEKEIPFIPDCEITWIEDGDSYSAVKYGKKIGPGVRKYPEFTVAQASIVRERLIVGVDPVRAGDFTDDELEKLKATYVKN